MGAGADLARRTVSAHASIVPREPVWTSFIVNGSRVSYVEADVRVPCVISSSAWVNV